MSEPITYLTTGPKAPLVGFGMNCAAVVAITLSAIAIPTRTSHAQWKLESGPSKKSPKANASLPPSNKPPSKKPVEKAEASIEPTEPPVQAPSKTAKPVSMQVIEKDHQRFVHVPRAIVRCGPGAEYYPTETLVKGTAVEVYVQTDDGWSGIRPPSGSHNWVQADAVYLLPGGRVAEVSAESVPAWVGSDTVKSEKLLFQTELVKTQSVAILGEAYRGQSDQKKLWFKIAPPQGEFRWIKSSMIGVTPVAKDPEMPSESKSNASASQVAQAAYQEPGRPQPRSVPSSKSELAWSDEDEQTQRVQQEIQREQQKAQSSILANAPKGSKQIPSAKSSSATRPPAKSMASGNPRTRSQSPAAQLPAAQPPTGRAASAGNDPWQLIHQRQVGPEQTDSMNHILGIFGLSLVDPSNIQGHPQQGRMPPATSPGPVSRIPFPSRTAAIPSAASNPSGSHALVENLPRPSGRYSQRRYSDFQYAPQESFADRPSPLRQEDDPEVSTASFAPYDSAPLAASAGAPLMDSYPQNRPSEGELEAFQTPQIQDALTQLSVIVSRPAEQWNLAPLRDSAKMWIERGETPLMRGEARLLLDRIERFESVRQRSSMTPLQGPTNFSDAVALRSPASESEMSGWLVAVHTSLAGQPEFALTDDLGNVKAYVRPTTGLNLRRYVQQPVTVFGPQGFLPNLNAKQVVADRVVRLR